MPSENRLPSDDSSRTRRAISPPFCRVERRDPNGKTRRYVVHTHSPKFVVEFEHTHSASAAATESAPREKASARPATRPVIRRVCVPNSWAGDYHHCARQLGAASEFFAETETHET